jgi:hypothetical protein
MHGFCNTQYIVSVQSSSRINEIQRNRWLLTFWLWVFSSLDSYSRSCGGAHQKEAHTKPRRTGGRMEEKARSSNHEKESNRKRKRKKEEVKHNKKDI